MGTITYQNKDVASKVTGEALVGNSLSPFGLPHLKIVGILPTNLPVVESNELRLDNLFLLSDGSIAIIDYESDFSRENFVKYVNYMARVIKRYSTAKQLKELKQIRMVVIYTADVEWAKERYDLGGIVLKTEAAYLVHLNSEEIYQRTLQKLEEGEPLDEEDMLQLMVLPLTVKGKEAKRKLAVKTVELARKIPDSSERVRVLAGILTFSDKIIDEEYSRKVREAMSMTKVERLIYEEGLEDGTREGFTKGETRGENRLGKLILSLLADKRHGDLERASKDGEYRKSLYQEYGI